MTCRTGPIELFIGKEEQIVPVWFEDDSGQKMLLQGKKVELLIGRKEEADWNDGTNCIFSKSKDVTGAVDEVSFTIPKTTSDKFEGAKQSYHARFKLNGDRTELLPVIAKD